jgi:(p)ppGpp synthase/HD superfamily hydrolase
MPKTSIHVEPTSKELLEGALDFAREAHSGQRRKQTGEPFVEHPIAVADLLAETGCDTSVLAAAYLHDVVEKTDVPLTEIRERFGDEVAELVDALSEDTGLSGYAERKRALRERVLASGRPATVIYAADRVANLRDWIGLPSEQRPKVAARLGTSLDERLRLWDEDLIELSAHDRELSFLGAIEIELRRLRSEG